MVVGNLLKSFKFFYILLSFFQQDNNNRMISSVSLTSIRVEREAPILESKVENSISDGRIINAFDIITGISPHTI